MSMHIISMCGVYMCSVSTLVLRHPPPPHTHLHLLKLYTVEFSWVMASTNNSMYVCAVHELLFLINIGVLTKQEKFERTFRLYRNPTSLTQNPKSSSDHHSSQSPNYHSANSANSASSEGLSHGSENPIETICPSSFPTMCEGMSFAPKGRDNISNIFFEKVLLCVCVSGSKR